MPQNCPARLFRYGELVLRLLAVYSFKGQLISECLFDFFKFSKKPTKNLTKFVPQNLKSGQIMK